MNKYDATEQAYKNGRADGIKEFFNELEKAKTPCIAKKRIHHRCGVVG